MTYIWFFSLFLCFLFLCSEIDKKMKEIDRSLTDHTEQVRKLQHTLNDLQTEQFALKNKTDHENDKLAKRETEYQVLMKDYEYAKEREAVLMGDK